MPRRWCVFFAVMLALPATIGRGQVPHAHHHHAILLAPGYGASAAASVIYAQAAYINAMGNFLVSAAVARRHHAIGGGT